MDGKLNFPYKTLIWAIFATLAIFVFNTELKQLITKTEEFSVFGVEIKASEDKANTLQDSIYNFKTTVADLSIQLANQQEKISNLDNLKLQLEKDLAECPQAKETSVKLSKQITQIFNANRDLKLKSDNLINTSILKSVTYDVKLIVPSNMINADIYVDGKEAIIVNTSGIFITVRVNRKNSSHRFELREGAKRCKTNKLIVKDATELPIVCNS